MRCLGLAQYLLDQGDECHLVSISSESFLLEQWYQELSNSGGLLTIRCENTGVKAGSDEDVKFTLSEAGIFSADWIVLDNYGFDAGFQRKLENKDFYLLYFDDYRSEYIGSDLVLNQNCQRHPAVENNHLTGTDYFLANRKLRRLIAQRNPAGISKGDILVTLGGADSENLGLNVVRKLFAVIPGSERIHFAFTSSQQELLHSREYSSSMKGRLVIHDYPSLVDIYPFIRFAICAGGVTSLELASLGIVCGLLVLADNQKDGTACLDELGVARKCNSIDEAADFIAGLYSAPEYGKQLAMNGMGMVDGYGPMRVYKKMCEIMKS